MPNPAKVLRFPTPARLQNEEPLSSGAALAAAESYLSSSESDEQRATIIGRPEVLFAVCKLLYERRDGAPARVAADASALFVEIRDCDEPIGLFDERDYFLGELALITGNATRQLGKWADAERWLNRAESSLRHILNPGPKLAEVGYLRLALKFDQRQFEDVLELTPSLLASFEKLEMRSEYAKTEFLRAMCLKGLGQHEHAFSLFDGLVRSLDPVSDTQLLGQTLIETGAFHASQRRYEAALDTFNKALLLLKQGTKPIFLAHLKATVGETLLLQGKLEAGVQAYREAISDYVELKVVTHAAYLRLVLADALMQIDRPREAEWEILAALPTIEEQKMVPEGFAAVALLKESARRRKTDPNALRELREHLQKSN